MTGREGLPNRRAHGNVEETLGKPMSDDGPVAYTALTQEPSPAVRQRQLAAVKHGLFVRAESGLRLRSRKVRRLAAKVQRLLPWLQPSDEPAVRGFCEL